MQGSLEVKVNNSRTNGRTKLVYALSAFLTMLSFGFSDDGKLAKSSVVTPPVDHLEQLKISVCKRDSNDWDMIWQPNVEHQMPQPLSVLITEPLGLGNDIENREWLMVSTQHHEIYFQPSADKEKVSGIWSRIDNIYEFLGECSSKKPEALIKAFLIPGEYGHSRCSMENAMRTGDRADLPHIFTSLLHEETHLFNFIFLDGVKQGWWAGEFTCIYYQQRALWEAQGKDIEEELLSKLPSGPQCDLTDIDSLEREGFYQAVSALYFFEEKYGKKDLIDFRQACLDNAKETNGGLLPDSAFEEVFGKSVDKLQRRWLRFYGWD